MVAFGIIVAFFLIVGGIVLGVLANKSGANFTDEDVQNFVFRNAFMNQIHDNFGLKK